MPADPDLHAHGIGWDRPPGFYTPYGCCTGATDQYVLDQAHCFGVPACVLRMSCSHGPLLGQDDAALAATIQTFVPVMTGIATAPRYLFWRCAPPELRVPLPTLECACQRG